MDNLGYSEGDSEKSIWVWLVGTGTMGDGPTVSFGTVDSLVGRLTGDRGSGNQLSNATKLLAWA